MADLIESIDVIPTGRGAQHKEHRHGSWMPRIVWALLSRSWVEMPINAFLIRHRDGLVMFDTGLDPAIKTDPDYIRQAIGKVLVDRIFQFKISQEDKLGEQLKAHGVDPAKIRTAVISHLHFDHIGGIADIPQADLVVSQAEWDQLSEPHPEHEWILREHIERPGAKWRPIAFDPPSDPVLSMFDGCFDLFGDGSMILLPTPGHTPGSLSMLVRTDGKPPVLLAGDLGYGADYIRRGQVPGTGDAQALRHSYAQVQALADRLPDLLVIPSHDDDSATALEAAFAR
jgi:glyoxylase-like metal-dependent hydrolase (beta-lactamase superfamily II)